MTQPLRARNTCLSIAMFREGRHSLVFSAIKLCLSPSTDKGNYSLTVWGRGITNGWTVIINNTNDDEIHCGGNSGFL